MPTRDRYLPLRVSLAELRRWKRAARADGRTLSSWVRVVLDRRVEIERAADEFRRSDTKP